MARIKAQPMNRLPNIPQMKNGFRAPPQPPATPSTYDANGAASAAYPPGQQRFIFANGSTTNFNNHIPLYGVSTSFIFKPKIITFSWK